MNDRIFWVIAIRAAKLTDYQYMDELNVQNSYCLGWWWWGTSGGVCVCVMQGPMCLKVPITTLRVTDCLCSYTDQHHSYEAGSSVLDHIACEKQCWESQ